MLNFDHFQYNRSRSMPIALSSGADHFADTMLLTLLRNECGTKIVTTSRVEVTMQMYSFEWVQLNSNDSIRFDIFLLTNFIMSASKRVDALAKWKSARGITNQNLLLFVRVTMTMKILNDSVMKLARYFSTHHIAMSGSGAIKKNRYNSIFENGFFLWRNKDCRENPKFVDKIIKLIKISISLLKTILNSIQM